MSKHLELIRAVNSSTTQHEHDRAEAKLYGWREGLEFCGRKWDFIAADEDTESLYPGRPYCCGVLLDWSPTDDICTEPECCFLGQKKARDCGCAHVA